MTEPINPLLRGVETDLILKALYEAGIQDPNLAFLLGVDPKTLRATVGTITKLGSVQTIPGADYLSQEFERLTIVPEGLYNLAPGNVLPTVVIDQDRYYRLSITALQADNSFGLVLLEMNVSPGNSDTSYTLRAMCVCGSAATYIFRLPVCSMIMNLQSGPAYGSAVLEAHLEPLPVGSY